METCFNPRTHTGCDASNAATAAWSNVSIHAPTRGATEITAHLEAVKKFQSTHPHGVRQCAAFVIYAYLCVSIHAPTRGATYTMKVFRYVQFGFNPRTHTGCDFSLLHSANRLMGCFNPRTHTGCDAAYFYFILCRAIVSIHAPTRGATPPMLQPPLGLMFQSTHPHGVRH